MNTIFENLFVLIELEGRTYWVTSKVDAFNRVSFESEESAFRYLGMLPPSHKFTFNL